MHGNGAGDGVACRLESRGLLVSERDRGLEPGGAAGRNRTGKQADGRHQDHGAGTTMTSTSAGRAPTAMRMPISLVRRDTENARVP